MNRRSIRFRLTAWYAGLLAGLLLLFGFFIYLGLEGYLKKTLEKSLSNQAQQIGETFLISVGTSGEDYVIDEIREHYAPELNSRFVRVTRSDGSLMYASGKPEDKTFDPTNLPFPSPSDSKETIRLARTADGAELLIHTLPFTAENGSRFRVEVGAPTGQVEQTLGALFLILFISLPVFIVVAAAGGYWIMRRALKPLDEMTRAAERISSRNLDERLPGSRTGDEVESLSVSLNHMIDRLDESFQHISRFSADASHELRTPLTILRGELESLVQRRAGPEELRESVASALEEVDRLTRIVESLLALSRLEAGEARMERVRVDLSELAATTVEQMRLLAEDKQLSVQCEVNESVQVEGDRSRLKQVVVNLLDNAIKYTPEGGSVRVGVKTSEGSALIEVEDSGVGIPPDALPHIFERFYRVDKARSRQMGGSGLGLSIVKSICAAHGGTIEAGGTNGRGTCFRVALPLLTRPTGNKV